MNIILFDDQEWSNLRPLTLTKPFSELRMGILTFRERWKKLLEGNYSYLTKDYLGEKFQIQILDINLFINPAFFPTKSLSESILNLKEGEILLSRNQFIAGKLSFEDFEKRKGAELQFNGEIVHVNRLWDLFTYNDYAIRFDFELLTKGRKSQPISETNGLINPQNIFLEEG